MTGRVTVVGLGPAGPELLTAEVSAAIEAHPPARRYLRTSRHPAAAAVGAAHSFDERYDAGETLEGVYESIVGALVDASAAGDLLYAVPGSPHVAERTVELLVEAAADVRVLPALSFADLAWVRLGVDPLAAGVRFVDGQRFAVEAAGERGPLLVAQCDSRAVLSDIKLAVESGPPVTVLQRLGLPDERVFTVEWADLDRSVDPDHLTALWIPSLAAPVGQELVRFAELVRLLRERCPWDQEQTHQTLTRHLLEEAHEVLEAIEQIDEPGGIGHLEEELGDLLFQVVFHATIATQAGEFTLADVARGIHDKLVHRHPHVFGDVTAETADAVMANWEQIKKAEKGRESLMDGIPSELPALLYAHKVQRKAASVGFDWRAESFDVGTAEELGDLLFGVVNAARRLGQDPEAALRGAAGRFRDRFRVWETANSHELQ